MKFSKQQYNFRSAMAAYSVVNQRLPNPDKVLQRRGQALPIYRELLSDAHLTAVLDSRESATLAYDWRVERDDCPPRLHNAIEKWFFSIIERKMSVEDLSRDELTSNLLDVIYWGYQPAELMWDYIYGLWLPVQIIPKPPEWFEFFINNDGVPELRFLSLGHMIDGERPPDNYTLICPRIKPSYENPYGRGVASRCFWPIVFKRAGLEFWLNCLERFGTPWVKGTINGPADQTALDAFAVDLKALVQDAVIAVSGSKNVELMESSGGSRQGSNTGFKDMIETMNGEISKTILGHTLSSDTADKASYAATKGALTVRDDIQKKDKKMVKSIWNDIINLIFFRNGYATTPRPNATPFHEEEVEEDRALRDEALSRAGVRFKKSYFVRAYHFQEEDLDDEVGDPSGLQATAPKRNKDKKVLNKAKEKKNAVTKED